MPEVVPGCEPFSATGSSRGALVVHGFTGCPRSMRPLADALAAAGFTVELPLLPGHGTSVDDILATSWGDWAGAVEVAFQELASRCDRLVVTGLSMGGTLAAWLAAHHPEIAGLAVVNPMIDPPAPEFRQLLQSMLDQGHATFPAIGDDMADPEAPSELAYAATPVAPLLSLCRAQDDLLPRLGDIGCPVLILTSKEDHVVPPVSSDVLAGAVSGPVRRVALERSYHVATLDYDRAVIERETVEFFLDVAAG